MKKLIVSACVMAIGVSALAGDLVTKSQPISVIGMTTYATNTAVTSVKGMIEAVRVIVPALATGTVTVVDGDGQTIFSKASITNSATFPVRMQAVTALGAVTDITNQTAKIPVSASVTTTVIGQSLLTNAYTVKLYWAK